MLRNCLKVEQLADPLTPAMEALSRIQLPVLQHLYALDASIPADSPASNLLAMIARRLGKLKRGGVPDLEATARHILNDWNNGKIAYCTPVPTEKPHLLSQAEIVTDFAPRFSFDDIFEDSTSHMDTEDLNAEETEINCEIDMKSDSTNDGSNIANTRTNANAPAASASDNDESVEYSSEDEVNFQSNQQKSKNFKKAQKKSAKDARRAMQE